jgi:glycerol-3-phosphate dehydrogenase (NAD(P)+)
MPHFGIVGGGAWGTALACVVRRAGGRVSIWSRDPTIARAIASERANPVYLPGLTLEAGIEAVPTLAALGGCDTLLLAAPAQAVRSLAPDLPGSCPVVICAKGVEASTGLLMPEVLGENLPGRAIAMLSGPSFAEEVTRGLPTAVSIATADASFGRRFGRGRLPTLLDRRRRRRGAGRRGQECTGDRGRHRRGPRARP